MCKKALSELREIFIMKDNYQMKIAICDDDEQDRANVLGMLSEYLDINNYNVKLDTYTSGE